jgi:hypothetical protein
MSFNPNFAVRYDQIAVQRVRPTGSYATDDGARQVTQHLIIDAGCDPVPVGGLTRPAT